MSTSPAINYPSDKHLLYRDFEHACLQINQAINPKVTFWGEKIIDTVYLRPPYDFIDFQDKKPATLDDIARKFFNSSDLLFKDEIKLSLLERAAALNTLTKLNALYTEMDKQEKNPWFITKIFIFIRERLWSRSEVPGIRWNLDEDASKNFRSFTKEEFYKQFVPAWIKFYDFFGYASAKFKQPQTEFLSQQGKLFDVYKTIVWKNGTETTYERYVVKEELLRKKSSGS